MMMMMIMIGIIITIPISLSVFELKENRMQKIVYKMNNSAKILII